MGVVHMYNIRSHLLCTRTYVAYIALMLPTTVFPMYTFLKCHSSILCVVNMQVKIGEKNFHSLILISDLNDMLLKQDYYFIAHNYGYIMHHKPDVNGCAVHQNGYS